MELIQNNPYRIAGLLSNTTERELQRNKSRFLKFAEVGKEIEAEYDFNSCLQLIKRDKNNLTQAFSHIQQNQDKVNFALFWFLNVSPFDKTAIEYLKNGDEKKAVEIWEKVTQNKEVNSKNFSTFNNLGTYKLLSRTPGKIKEGIEAKIKLIESEYFENFVHSVADETFTIDNEKQIEKFIDECVNQFKNEYSSTAILDLFSNCNVSIRKYLLKKFTEGPVHNIESQIESTKTKRKNDNSKAYNFGLNLVSNSKHDLEILQALLTNTDLKYTALADQLASEIMQCGIDYFNYCKGNDSSDNYIELTQKLTKIADGIAVGKLTKDRTKDSLITLEEMKDQEVNQAVVLLSSIKSAYDKAISEIDAEVSVMRVTMSYNQTINYTKVDKMKANCLDWSKVVEVISNEISMNDVATIQGSSNQSKVSEYKNLVDFLFSKIGPIQINKVKYLCYWKDVRASQAKSAAKKIGRTTIDTATAANDASGGCLGEIFNRLIGIIIMVIVMSIIVGIISLFD